MRLCRVGIGLIVIVLFVPSCAIFSGARTTDGENGQKLGDRSRTILKTRRRDQSLRTERLRRKTRDVNDDGQPDQTTYLTSNGHTALITRDFNFDGRIDLWQYYNRSGDIVEEEMNLDKDKFIDLIQFHRKGVIRRKLMSVGFEQKFTITKYYDESGQLLRVELDQNRDGRTDTWEYYEDGKRTRIGWDEDLDGVADMFNKF